MNAMKSAFLSVVLLLVMFACDSEKIKETNRHSDFHVVNVDRSILGLQKKIYLPIYSDIYYRDTHHIFSLTATLSIRNTSFNDSIYLFSIDYYNSLGKKIRRYNEATLMLKPMESLEFVVEDNDDTGGVGANFVVDWGAKVGAQHPYIQGVMIGTTGQQGISFTTEGIEIQ
jgi:hypothetical protein